MWQNVISPHLKSFASLTLPKIRCPALIFTAGYPAASKDESTSKVGFEKVLKIVIFRTFSASSLKIT